MPGCVFESTNFGSTEILNPKWRLSQKCIRVGISGLSNMFSKISRFTNSGFDSSQNTSIVWCSCPTADKMLKSDVTLRSKIQFGVCPSPYTTDNSFAIAALCKSEHLDCLVFLSDCG